MTEIIHYDASDNRLLRIAYTWNLDNTLAERLEHVTQNDAVEVRFTYDNRKRLIREKRYIPDMVPAVLYELAYTYDQLGNRVTKHDVVNDVQTCYVYDISRDPATGQWDPSLCFAPTLDSATGPVTHNNRLVEYRVLGPESGGNRDLWRTVRYVYTNRGDVAHILLKDEWTGQGQAPPEYDRYYALRLVYSAQGTLWLAVSENWEGHWTWTNTNTHAAEYVREFRYDAPRHMYVWHCLVSF